MKKNMIAFLVSVFVIFFVLQEAEGGTFDQSLFDQILREYVDDKGLIDYNGIAGNSRFETYMASLKTVKTGDMSRNEQLAFWINAYNAVTIDKVIKWKPKKSVRETIIPGVWSSTKFFTTREHIVAGSRLSQDDIEHEILRKKLKDPRIHFAIICASSGCPLQARFAFTEENVQARLDEVTRQYLDSERGIRIDEAENTLYMSKIFDWFGSDFVAKSGSVIDFVSPYLKKEVLMFIDRKPKISYLHYDWALNAKESLR
jgi:hypothetical protein